jgi:hypothetical protein
MLSDPIRFHSFDVSPYQSVTDKTVGKTAVGVLAHTVPYNMPYSLSCYVVDYDGPRTASNNTLHYWREITVPGSETRLLTLIASDRIDGNGDVTSA